jgi:23S rRNA (uracil1939-C5)-methyltransferase
MGSHRVVPLARECEVVGIETARDPKEEETWELDGRVISGEQELAIRVEEFIYHLSTSSFFQINRHLLSTLLRLVSGHAARVRKKGIAVDLFAGIGFFSLPLSKIFERVIAVEGAHVRWLRRNAPPNVEVVHGPVEAFDLPAADFVFLDPPRAGAKREVIESIGRGAAEMICYLSCDPVTFSRDASRLIASGWRISTLDLLDLFPNTHHVETLASFERAT